MDHNPLSSKKCENFKKMLIGELAKRTGLSRDTIRFYEKKGLISVNRKERRENNYKEYSDEILERLFLLKKIKGFGFTLNEADELLAMIEEKTATCSTVSSKLQDKIAVIEAKIKELMDLKQMMETMLKNDNSCCSPQPHGENCPALVSDFSTSTTKVKM